MTDSTNTSRDFAPSWLLKDRPTSVTHNPPPPFRPVPNQSFKDRSQGDDFDRITNDRKVLNGFRHPYNDFQRFGSSENHYSGFNRISDFEHEPIFRRSNSISNTFGRNIPLNRTNGYSVKDRTKNDRQFRGEHTQSRLPFRDTQSNGNGTSYSIVTSKSLKVEKVPGSPVLHQSDFPSLGPSKQEPNKSTDNSVWGNPPHRAKLVKRNLSGQSSESGGTILGPHYGKGFFNGVLTRENIKDEVNADALTSSDDGLGGSDYSTKSEYIERTIGIEEEEHRIGKESVSSAEDEERGSPDQDEPNSGDEGDEEVDEACGWPNSEDSPDEGRTKSSLSSSGSTGSVDSIDSHHSHMSGTTAMMVEDLLDEIISEEEKMQIMHALEEIKMRTGYGSYYERVALTDNHYRSRRLSFLLENKTDEDEEDPDDRFLK